MIDCTGFYHVSRKNSKSRIENYIFINRLNGFKHNHVSKWRIYRDTMFILKYYIDIRREQN